MYNENDKVSVITLDPPKRLQKYIHPSVSLLYRRGKRTPLSQLSERVKKIWYLIKITRILSGSSSCHIRATFLNNRRKMDFYKVFINILESMGYLLVVTVKWEGTKEGIRRALLWAYTLSLVSDRSCTRSPYPFLGHKRDKWKPSHWILPQSRDQLDPSDSSQ